MAQAKPAEPHTVTKTPSGIEIAYYDEPRRYYEVRKGWAVGMEPQEQDLWVEVPSVTTVLDVLDKPLGWWGMKTGVEGVVALWDKGILQRSMDGKLAVKSFDQKTWEYADVENVTGQLNLQKLTVNHTVRSAGDRGREAHDAFEAWAITGAIPEPANYNPEVQPYIRGLRQFCLDMGENWETEGVEVAVGSVEHQFAGRYDLRGKLKSDTKLITQSLTKDGKGPLKRGVKHTTIPGGTTGLIDLKTSKGIYPTHLMQLEGYEGAGIECGLEPTDWRAVLHISMHGTYEIKRAKASYEDFLAVRQVYDAMKRVEAVL